MSAREERNRIVKRQGGLSPLTRNPLRGKRLETHHVQEICEGGNNNRNNLQALPIAEHLAEHFRRWLDPQASEEDRLRELDTVFGRLSELTPAENRELSEAIFMISGRRIHFA